MTSITSSPTFSLAYLEAVRNVRYQMAAAFSFMVWDFLLTIGEETKYVWQMRRCMSKWFYFYFRYFLLAAQIFHLAITPILSSGRMPDSLCTIWYQYVIILPQLSILVIDIILITRVFLLFNRSRRVGVFLGNLILVDLGVTATRIVRCPVMAYFEACMLLRPPNDIEKAHTTIIMVIQSIIVGMVVFKHFVGLRLGWGRTPLLSLLARDATSNYLVTFVICGIAMAAFCLDDQRAIAIFYWSISLFSTIGCRLVLNMERFARKHVLDDEIQFTSRISVYPMTVAST